MLIKKLTLKNFRGYKEITIPFQSGLNLIIGDNGSGKTAILEALTVSMGSFFLGIRNTSSRNILTKDVHISSFEHSEEYGFPVIVQTEGLIDNQNVTWQRQLNKLNSTTLIKGAAKIKAIGKAHDYNIRQGENITLPVLGYYATGRLFDEAKVNKKNFTKTSPEIASRFRAYNDCLKAKMTFKRFLNWFQGKELSTIQKRTIDISFEIVRAAIINTIPDCKDIFFEMDPDKSSGLKVILTDNRTLPFTYLSDGTRNFIAIIADIAHKCVTLNPHLKENALTQTSGIILIDELALHLHPDWQKKIIKSLINTFPLVQFICTTHSPFLIQETGINQLIKLKNNELSEISRGNNLSIEDIAENLQDIENPQWSQKRNLMFEKSKEYYLALSEGTATQELKDELDEAMAPFALDTAYYAILEQERLIREKNKK